MSRKSRAPARIAAVIALAVAVVALMMIVSSAQETEDGPKAARDTTEQAENRAKRPRRAVYVIKDGDTLLGIAGKTGVQLSRLQELNPDVDPQRLIAGQRIRLR